MSITGTAAPPMRKWSSSGGSGQPHRLTRRIAGTTALIAGSLLALSWTVASVPVHAATVTAVSLTFDDGDESQYSLAFQRGLQPSGMHGTFYIVTGNTDVNSGAMTWSELASLYSDGSDVGGHTVDHIDLTSSSYTLAEKSAEVCDNFQALTDHGLNPASFAYPYGAYDATAEQIVQSCGFSSARITGGIDRNGVGAGPVYAETIPPQDPYAVRTVYNGGGSAPLTLSYLENSVTAAAQNGGGWVPFVFHEICSQVYDPANYSYCATSWAPLELDTFKTFLGWLQNAGQPGGAPAGTVVQTVRGVITGPPPPGGDTTPPSTTISCNSTPCTSGWYNTAPVSVELSATDAGSGVDQTIYTTDGSDPRTSDTAITYTEPFTISETTTATVFSTDLAGNSEQPHSQLIQIDTAAPTVKLTAPADGSFWKRSSKVAVSASTSDSGTGSGAPSGVARVVFLLDGTTTLATDTSAPYQFTWRPQGVSIGRHVLTAISIDRAGNSTTAAPVTVNITR